MSKLETYIKQQKNAMDTFEPSQELWLKINAGMSSAPVIKSNHSWLKYFAFGASAIAVAVCLHVSGNKEVPSDKPVKSGIALIPELPARDTTTEISLVTTETRLPVPASMDLPPGTVRLVSPEMPAMAEATPELPVVPAALPGIPEAAAPPSLSAKENVAVATAKDTDEIRVDTLFEGVTRLEVNSESSDITINSSDKPEISLKASLKCTTRGMVIGKPDYKISYERTGMTLKVSVINVSKTTLIAGSMTFESELHFEVPKTTDLSVISKYGDVSVKNTGGRVFQMELTSGDLRLENISSDVKLKMGYGNLKADNIQGNLDGSLNSGDITIVKQKGNIEVKTSYGNQTYKEISGNIRSVSTSGDVRITDMKGDADLTSSYGNIDLDHFTGRVTIDATSGDMTGKDVELTGNMKLRCKYGTVKMGLLNEMDKLSFDLNSKYGEISIDKNGQKLREENKLFLKQGDILVEASTESGDQFYK